MKTIVIGKTDSTLTLNKCKTYIRGKVEAVIDITNDDQRRELAELENANLICVIDNEDNIEIKAPATRQPTEQERITRAEAKTQEMGSRVVISNGNGTAEGKMRRSAIGDICDSDRTNASVEALKKIEEEEKDGEIADDLVINESKLDPSEQMGRKAVVSTGDSYQSVKMVNKLMGEVEAVKRDPFIDKKDNAEREKLLAKESKHKIVTSAPFEEIKDDYVPELSDTDLFIGEDPSPSDSDFIE